ncbi:hypothetical protein [Pseudovibrio sp. SPO723]|uniref:hypothetical protein n=1 Tax=Nesiotobacter zosterae TaxID=392721 RepID=UPI0029C2912B|nr:hypothetical protein [Pseudovibrio sp. SPO723]MDX5592592.1 hypothetical protein [Pseudovibrio sp. SPO723]
MTHFPAAEEAITLLSQDVADAFKQAAEQLMLPHVTMRPHVLKSGSEWVAEYGEVQGRGVTPMEACLEFDAAWTGAQRDSAAA